MQLRRPFLFLLVSLGAAFVLIPLLDRPDGRGGWVQLLLSGVLLTGIGAAAGRRGMFRTAVVLAAAALGLRWAWVASPTPALHVGSLASSLLFLAFTVVVILTGLARQRSVTLDTVLGGVSTYLLLGLGWALGYLLIEAAHPGSFHGLPSPPATSDALYLSFVTITTLGYGDIVPLTRAARTATTAEAIVGQLFVAIFIAYLVGLYSVGRGAEDA